MEGSYYLIMWIAKNSVTGKTYGKSYSSIYDCQAFIDRDLMFLEYEMRRAFAMEVQVVERLKYSDKDFLQSIVDELSDSFSKCVDEIGSELKPVMEYSIGAISQEKYDKELSRLASARWQKNNIIRCWYVEQNRFADGFDF